MFTIDDFICTFFPLRVELFYFESIKQIKISPDTSYISSLAEAEALKVVVVVVNKWQSAQERAIKPNDSGDNL